MGEGVDAALSMSVSMSLLAEGELASAPANVCVKESSARRVRFALWLSCASRSGSSRDRLLRGRSMSIMLAVTEGGKEQCGGLGVGWSARGELKRAGSSGGASERCGGVGGGRTLARERWFQFRRAPFPSAKSRPSPLFGPSRPERWPGNDDCLWNPSPLANTNIR